MTRINQLKPAVRRGNKARLALCGPTGAGKTWTALEAATAFVEGTDKRILLIDSERGSASLYAGIYDFDTIEWEPPYDPVELAVDLLKASESYGCIILDSASHFWMGEGGTLDIVNAAAAKMFGGNRFSGWSEGTPAQNLMVDAFLASRCHLIVTMRSKMEYILVENDKGRQTPQKVGMEPIQRAGVEYEFTVVADMDTSHNIFISKSRCDILADRTFRRGQSKDMAVILRDWLAGNEDEFKPADEGDVALIKAKIKNLDEAQLTLLRDNWKLAGISPLEKLLAADVDAVQLLIENAKKAEPPQPATSEADEDEEDGLNTEQMAKAASGYGG